MIWIVILMLKKWLKNLVLQYLPYGDGAKLESCLHLSNCQKKQRGGFFLNSKIGPHSVLGFTTANDMFRKQREAQHHECLASQKTPLGRLTNPQGKNNYHMRNINWKERCGR